ncbi:thiolase family protein [Nocardioides immobilis]|uniref:Thiolase family protein n=1 Tax=Nocardioides immobilis TaxID=2049295 RepID=A0A417Y6M8_9ACTN|nr:thiolase family protein [Nocardioides immobilis]RHW28340.1 thiolase family protein [Nocardioides immobilis]
MAYRAAVAGVGLTEATSPRKQTRSTIELCQQAVQATLAHSGASPDSIDAIVTGNIDGFEGTVLGAKHVTRLLGIGADLPVTIVNTGGTTGGNLMQVAARMVRSGTHRRVLVLGGPTFFGSTDLQSAINTNSPMIIEQPLGMGGYHMGAFAASAYQERYGLTADDLAAVAVADHAKASRNPFAHLRYEMTPEEVLAGRPLSSPLTQPMVCPISTSAVAMLVADPEDVADLATTPALIKAMGMSADPYLGGGKGDFSRMQNLANLARRVYALADIRDPLGEFDAVEIFAPYAHMQPMQLEALGFAPPGGGIDLIRSGATDAGGTLPTNMSGGPKCTNAGVAGELAPYAYAALQVMGDAPASIQIPGARRSLGHGTGGSFFQFENLAIFESLARSN